MIITRSPLRITLGGGGTDFPFFFQKFNGNFVSAAIDKHVYVSINEINEKSYVVRYSNYEKASTLKEIKHPINKIKSVGANFYGVVTNQTIKSESSLKKYGYSNYGGAYKEYQTYGYANAYNPLATYQNYSKNEDVNSQNLIKTNAINEEKNYLKKSKLYFQEKIKAVFKWLEK